MRQHVLQVGKSQDTHHGIMGMCRILLEPMGTQGWCITSSGIKDRVAHVRRGRWLEKGDTGEVGGQEDFGCSWWREAAEECGSLCPVASALGQLPLSNPSRHMENGVMKQRSED